MGIARQSSVVRQCLMVGGIKSGATASFPSVELGLTNMKREKRVGVDADMQAGCRAPEGHFPAAECAQCSLALHIRGGSNSALFLDVGPPSCQCLQTRRLRSRLCSVCIGHLPERFCVETNVLRGGARRTKMPRDSVSRGAVGKPGGLEVEVDTSGNLVGVEDTTARMDDATANVVVQIVAQRTIQETEQGVGGTIDAV